MYPYLLIKQFFIMCSLLCYSLSIFAQQTILLSPQDNIIQKIGMGHRGDIFLLQNGQYTISSSIKVPSGVTVLGDSESIISSPTPMIPFFDVTDTHDVMLKNFNLILQKGQIGILSLENFYHLHHEGQTILSHVQGLNSSIVFNTITNTTNLTIEGVSIRGNIFHDLSNANDASYIGIYLEKLQNARILSNKIDNTRGGIYALGTQIEISGNTLTRLNFGSIVTSGTHIQIINNSITEPGMGFTFDSPEGDGITLITGSYIDILNNIIDTGHCYMIWAHGATDHVNISNNILRGGVTLGIFFDQGSHIVIQDNQITYNSSYGIGFTSGNNLLIQNNTLTGNSLYLSSTVTQATVQNNVFTDINPIQGAFNVPSNNITLVNNVITNSDPTLLSQLTVFTDTGDQIEMGSTYLLPPAPEFPHTFFLKNTGENTIVLNGKLIVLLSQNTLPPGNIGNPAGESQYGGFLIKARNQPRKRVLYPGESTQFTIQLPAHLTHYTGRVTVNIPTTSSSYQPFNFILQQP